MSQPEISPWYVEPLREIELGGALAAKPDQFVYHNELVVEDDGLVRFSRRLKYEEVISGGYEEGGDHFEIFAEIRRRLGLKFDLFSTRDTDLGSFERESRDAFSISIYRHYLTDAEAMFLIALPHARKERPVEKVLEELRECSRLGLKQTVEVEEQTDAESMFEKVNFDRVLRYDQVELATMLSRSEAVMKFVDSFSRYKQLMSGLPTSATRVADIKELAKIEAGLEEQQLTANAAMRLGKKKEKREQDWWKGSDELVNPADYSLDIALELTDIRDPRYVNRYSTITFQGVPKDMPIPERQKLRLVMLPKEYDIERRRANRNFTEDSGW
ncbi:hypothetical protein BH10PAT3_BH10PAT3_8430 [soil metagenome]